MGEPVSEHRSSDSRAHLLSHCTLLNPEVCVSRVRKDGGSRKATSNNQSFSRMRTWSRKEDHSWGMHKFQAG